MNLPRRKRVAIVRGANLNKFEMQTYEALSRWFEVEAFCSLRNNFSLDSINLPITKLMGLEVLIPRSLRKYYNFLFDFVLEVSQPMFGLVGRLKGFDIVHIPDFNYYYSYQAAKARSKYGLKLVSTHAENIPFNFGRNRLSRLRMKKVISAVDCFLPLSVRARECLVLWGIPDEKIALVPFGVDTQIFRPLPREQTLSQRYDIPSHACVILYAGRLVRSKGVFELVYAIKRLLDDEQLKGKTVRLLLMGSGRARSKAVRLICRFGLSGTVRVVESAGYERMADIHNLADIFVLPSIPTKWWAEQFGMVLIESMACGKAIVATRTGSIPEVVGDSGILVQPADHLSLYQAFKQLVLDERLREELGRKARARVEKHFSVEVVSEKLKRVYESL